MPDPPDLEKPRETTNVPPDGWSAGKLRGQLLGHANAKAKVRVRLKSGRHVDLAIESVEVAKDMVLIRAVEG